MLQAAHQRLGPLEGVVVVLQHHGYPVLLEQRHPVLPLVLASPVHRLAILADGADGVAVGRVGRHMVDHDGVRQVLPRGQGAVQPSRLGPLHFRGVPRVQQHQAQIVPKIQRVVAGLGKKSVEQRVKEGGLVPRTVPAIHLVVADAGHQGNQPAPTVHHGGGVITDERQAGLGRPPVVIAQVAADHREHRVLPGRQPVVLQTGQVHPAVAA